MYFDFFLQIPYLSRKNFENIKFVLIHVDEFLRSIEEIIEIFLILWSAFSLD